MSLRDPKGNKLNREEKMKIYETEVTEEVIEELILLSKAWEEENSCYGYRANGKEDIEGNRVFLAEENGVMLGYLFGKIVESENASAVIPDATPYFEAEELYVSPPYRSKGIGRALFRFAENVVKDEARYIVLSTATKNWKAVFHFYLDELEMTFWNARLFKKLR